MKKTNRIHHPKLFLSQPGLLFGFSTRTWGSMSPRQGNGDAKKVFLEELGLTQERLTLMNQVHGDHVFEVTQGKKNLFVQGTDGLVTQEKDCILGVRVADCVPLFFYDPDKKVIGVAHAGWRGTHLRLAQQMIKKMKLLGASEEKLLVFIGPHIGPCCYDIPKERETLFRQEFGPDTRIFQKREGKTFLDLGYLNLLQCEEMSINPAHIEVSPLCTSCEKELFFSYRRDTKEMFGEMMGILCRTL